MNDVNDTLISRSYLDSHLTITWTGICSKCNAEHSMTCRDSSPGYIRQFKDTRCMNCYNENSLVMTAVNPDLMVPEGL